MDTVIVNGVTLTRTQVEQAMKDLNQESEIKCLTRVRNRAAHVRGIVITGPVQRRYWGNIEEEEATVVIKPYTVVDETGCGQSYETATGLLQYWTPY